MNAVVDSHLILHFRIETNQFFQVSLEVVPVSAPEVRAVRWEVNGRATHSINENRDLVRA